MRGSDRLSAPERARIVPGDSELACLRRDFEESQTDLEAPQYWPENLRLAGKKGVRALVMERCGALHNFRVCLRPWASDGLIGINSRVESLGLVGADRAQVHFQRSHEAAECLLSAAGGLSKIGT